MAIAPAAMEAGPAQAEAQGPAERRQPPGASVFLLGLAGVCRGPNYVRGRGCVVCAHGIPRA